MAIEHKDITDGQRHEPKGASTASTGSVYVSDGAGSGSWTTPVLTGQASSLEGQILKADGAGNYSWKNSPEGWAHYKHNSGTQTFTGTASKIQIDGLGGATETSYLPYIIRGTGELWDNVTNKIAPIVVGDTYNIRLDLPVTAEAGNPTELTLFLDIGGTASITIPVVTEYTAVGKATPYTVSTSFNIFCLATFVANGGQLFLQTDTGSVTTTNPAITVIRTTAGDF